MYLLDQLGLFYRPKRQISTLSYTSTSEVTALSYTWSPKKVPLSGEASPYRSYREYRYRSYREYPPPSPQGWSKRLPAPFTIVAVWGTRNLIYILVFILLSLPLTILILIFLLLFSLNPYSPNWYKYSSGFYSQSWTCFGLARDFGNKIRRACVMFWYY